MVPHLGHIEPIVAIVVTAQYNKEKMVEKTPTSLTDNVQRVRSLKLTFAGLDALKPVVTSLSVAGTATILIPSTARSATTDSAGFLECATVWARPLISDR